MSNPFNTNPFNPGGGGGGGDPTKEETLENKTIPLEKNNITATNAVGKILIIGEDGIAKPLEIDESMKEEFVNLMTNDL